MTAICGYVLAGGVSSRFGRDKALAEFAGQTVLTRSCDLLEGITGSVRVVAAAGRYTNLRYQVVEDRWPGEGPLGGILTALHAIAMNSSDCDWNLIVSCDMPFLTRDWLIHMAARTRVSAAQVIVPRSKHGLEPLCACWSKGAAAKLQAAFDQGVRKVTEAMKRLRVEVLDETHWKRFDSAGRLFWNMNTQQDYEEAVRVWEAGQR